MRWTNELFYILLLNSITGAIAYGFWSVLKKNMARRKKLKYIYPMLGIVEAFFIFPIMYSYLKISTHVPESHGAYYGTLFLRTPFIYNVQCVIAGIWIVGAVWNLAKYAFQYLKFQKVLEKSVSFRLPETEKNKIIQELGMKGNVELYQNYAVTSPIVIGWRQKKIVFPVREYEEKELTTILYHELVHIRQHILEMKKMGIFLKLIFWCNPMMNGLLRSIDMWGEIACDRYVCSETAYPYTVQEYYTVAVDGLEQSHLWMPKMVTGFRKKSNFKSRILQMKNYKKENDFKRIGGITLVVFLCAVCTTTTFAAGEGFKAGYEELFDSTAVMVEEEPTQLEELTQYEETFDLSGYRDYERKEIDGGEYWAKEKSGEIEETVAKCVITTVPVYVEKGQVIHLTVSVSHHNDTTRVGIIDEKNQIRFVYGNDTSYTGFEIQKSGNYRMIFINDTIEQTTIHGMFMVV